MSSKAVESNLFASKQRQRCAACERPERPCFAEWEPKPTTGKIEFGKKPGVTMHSVHSQNEGCEGMNVLAWVMDEASAFRTANGVDNAENVYGTLRSSAQSRFGWMHWIGAIISFPRKQQGDFTLKKYEQSLKSDNIFGDRAATWEVHPRWEQGHPMYQASSDQWTVIEDLNVRVPKEFEEDFLHDGVDALTKYMAQPPLTEGGFFENPHMITEAVNRDLSPLVASVGSRQEILAEGIIRNYVTREITSFPPVVDGAPYFMHGDPGLKKDAFSICLCHTLPDVKVVNEAKGRNTQIQKVVVDFVLSWDPRPGRPVDLLQVDEVIETIAKLYNVRRVTFDRWNSAQSIQKLVAMGIDADDMNFSNADQLAMYRYLRLCFSNAMIELPPGDEVTQNELKCAQGKVRAGALDPEERGVVPQVRARGVRTTYFGPVQGRSCDSVVRLSDPLTLCATRSLQTRHASTTRLRTSSSTSAG